MAFSPDPSHSPLESTASQIATEHWCEAILTRLAHVTQQIACNHISQELGFPRSY